MRFKRNIRLERGLNRIYIAPLIDVLFLLTAFLMFASGFTAEPGIRVNLPKAVTGEAASLKNIEIAVSAENIAYLDGREITAQGLKKLLNETSKRSQGILIKSDLRASLRKVAEIWGMCRDLGITQVNIVTIRE